jgi:hypothetical protein
LCSSETFYKCLIGCRLDNWALIHERGRDFFSLPLCPDQLCCPPSLLSDGYQELFPYGLRGQGMKMTTGLHLLPRLRCVVLYLHSPHVFMAWYKSVVTKLITGFSWLRIGSSGSFCEHGDEPSGSIRKRDIF